MQMECYQLLYDYLRSRKQIEAEDIFLSSERTPDAKRVTFYATGTNKTRRLWCLRQVGGGQGEEIL